MVHHVPPTTPGHSDVLVGLQYGDEGKAKVIDMIAGDYDVIARFNGGANAGHTIDTPRGRIVLQQVPSAVFHEHVTLYIGSGCALNLWKLIAEIELIESAGIDLTGRLVISDRCAVVAPTHFVLDGLNSDEISTTRNGIGPCYADRARRVSGGERSNWQLRDLLADTDAVVEVMRRAVEIELGAASGLGADAREETEQRFASIADCVERVRAFAESDPAYLSRRVAAGANVLFEGAQSLMLDVVHGDQPFVTSSHTVPAYAYVGGDLPPRFHRSTIGVAKAIVSRVGNGPFPTELGGEASEEYFDAASRSGRGREAESAEYDAEALLGSDDDYDLGVALRMLTNEYGAGTGRPRRVGILDLDQMRTTVETFGIDVVYLNKVDCLDLYGRSRYEGVPVKTTSANTGASTVTVLPVFSTENCDPSDETSLPAGARKLKDFIEEQVHVRVAGFGLGPERERMVRFADAPVPDLVGADSHGGA